MFCVCMVDVAALLAEYNFRPVNDLCECLERGKLLF